MFSIFCVRTRNLGHNAKLVSGVAGQTAVNSQKGYRTR